VLRRPHDGVPREAGRGGEAVGLRRRPRRPGVSRARRPRRLSGRGGGRAQGVDERKEWTSARSGRRPSGSPARRCCSSTPLEFAKSLPGGPGCYFCVRAGGSGSGSKESRWITPAGR
jgi:hypothetical protein